MSHYFKKYSGNDTETDRKKAIKDCKEFLGTRNFNRMSKELADEYRKNDVEDTVEHRQQLAEIMSIAGVSGYSAKVWAGYVMEMASK